jgi:hypothetical protein
MQGKSGAAFVGRPIELSEIVSVLDKTAAVSYVLDSDQRFEYCNPAWDRFARDNGAPDLSGKTVLGTALFAAIPDVLRLFYSGLLEQVRRTGLVWQHVYECSSPEKFRKFRMRTHLLHSNRLLVTNTLVVEKAHLTPAEDNRDAYACADGTILMCAHCRCSRRIDKAGQWDFVPAHLAISAPLLRVSHGLCPICRAYFYSAQSAQATDQ